MHTKLHRVTHVKAGNYCEQSEQVTETKNLYGRKFFIFWIWDSVCVFWQFDPEIHINNDQFSPNIVQ